MTIDVVPLSKTALVEYAGIPIAFDVTTVLHIARDHGGDRIELVELPVETSYVKDYDAHHTPMQWPARFDTSQWILVIARVDGACVGGATVACATPEVDPIEGRADLAVLWDIRVRPEHRRRGVGATLFGAVEIWTSTRGYRELKAETQNINVAACRFYARRGCVLRAVHDGVYPECPDEVQLLWYKNLAQ
jgi:GNAT superfamily N-acetyltransferase